MILSRRNQKQNPRTMKTIQFLSITIFKNEDVKFIGELFVSLFRLFSPFLWISAVVYMAVNYRSPITLIAIAGTVILTVKIAQEFSNVVKNDFQKRSSIFRHGITALIACIAIAILHVPFITAAVFVGRDIFSVTTDINFNFLYIAGGEILLFVVGMYIITYKKYRKL